MIAVAAGPIVINTGDHGFAWPEWSTIIAALIAAVVAVAGYALTQAWARRERRAKTFADALAAVEDYLEAPYRIRRRSAATADARAALTTTLSDLQSRIAMHLAWLQVEAPGVGSAYAGLVVAARAEAGQQMAEAWATAPPADDAAMNLKVSYPHPMADAARAKVITEMRNHLRLWPVFAR